MSTLIKKIPYFAYGSNLNSNRIHLNNKSAVFKSVALLEGYCLEFCFKSKRWGGSAANIIPSPTSHVYGVLWELSESDLPYLDKQEGVDLRIYERQRVEVVLHNENNTKVNCLTYMLTGETRNNSLAESGKDQKPSISYKKVIVDGAVEHNLPLDYINYLKQLSDNGEEIVPNLSLPD